MTMKIKTFFAVLILYTTYSCNDDVDSIRIEPISDLKLDNLVIKQSNIPYGFYNDLVFTSENTAYAASRLGGIVKTTDGGTTWTSLNSTVNFNLQKIQFVSNNTGYIIGGNETGSYLLKTNNAGQTWNVINLNSAEKGSPTGMFFINENEGYITGAKLFIKTTNGGASWTPVLIKTTEDFVDVKFRDLNYGIATTGKSNYYKTTNGGSTWQNITPTNENMFSKIYFVYGKTILKSNNQLVPLDGGRSITLPNPVTRLQFLTDSKCIGIGQHYDTGFFPYGDILLTNNNWTSFVQKSYQPSSEAVDFTAIARKNYNQTMIIGTGQLYTKIVTINY